MEALPTPLTIQTGRLLLLAVAVGCVAWTITHEEVFREPRDYCKEQARGARNPYRRKFFYLFTCEYCFSHYAAAIFVAVTQFQLLYAGWRGYLIAWFALVWVANQYMSIYNRLRLDIKHENLEIKVQEKDVEKRKAA